MVAVESKLAVMVAANNAAYGEGKWLAVYGGDNANAAKPDVGSVMDILGSKLGVHVLAIQCAHYAGCAFWPRGFGVIFFGFRFCCKYLCGAMGVGVTKR